MFGWKKRARELETQLAAAVRKIASFDSLIRTHEYNTRTALTRRDLADTRTAALRSELVKAKAANQRLRSANAALERRLAARAAGSGPTDMPGQRKDGAA
ncbi:hypothetical protein ABIA32_002746 [Streptacidiphilus sp. MAP12-20]|uniref:hypothetical protein n=1 Tax=Streptacidiphilus sp. MAP12-20 TaxID=3156299 RepID=UPI0035195CCB